MTLLPIDLIGKTTAQQSMRGDLLVSPVFQSMGERQEVRRRGGLDCRALQAAEVSRTSPSNMGRIDFSFCRLPDRHDESVVIDTERRTSGNGPLL
jgi:hypothetical protein